MQPPRLTAFACALFTASSLAAAAVVDGPVGRDAEKGDPARWYEPADTPQEQHRNAMQEATAALAEALKECRAGNGARNSDAARRCEAEARARYEDDVERARGFLVRSTLG
jgi:type VI protein secretion system component VasF